MNTHRVNAAAGVLHAAMQQGKSLPQALAYGLEAAGLLQSPESAAELAGLRARVAELEALTPARYQTCRKCNAAYLYGNSCSNCEFQARIAAAQEAQPKRRPLGHDLELPEVPHA